MFWLAKFFIKGGGKTVDDAVKYFTKINGRPPSGIEKIRIQGAFMEAQRSNIIQFPKDRITDWTKARPQVETKVKVKSAEDQYTDDIDAMYDRQQKEMKAIKTDQGMGFYSEIGDLMKRHDLERLELDYDKFFNKILKKAKQVEIDPKPLLEAEFGKKLTGKETTTELLNLFKNRPKKASGGRIEYGGGKLVLEGIKAGLGKFTKSEVLIEMMKNTLKGSKDAYVKKNFPTFIKELTKNPDMAKNPNVWKFFTQELPANQRLVVHSDDTVDFFRQSEFGPHNIEATTKFQKEHPFLSRDQATKILNMEPEDRVLEMTRLEKLSRGQPHASGGRIGFAAGEIVKGGRWFIKMFKKAQDEMIWGSGNVNSAFHKLPSEEKARILQESKALIKRIEGGGAIPDEFIQKMKNDPNFKLVDKTKRSPDPDLAEVEDLVFGEDRLKHFDVTDKTKHASGGLAYMLGEPTYSDGGRIGFKGGTKFSPSKRKFLKGAGAGLGVLSMLPFVGKFFKPAAKAAKALTKVPIEPTGGMPVWFPRLVNKVINEGTDVTKKLATIERETVHTTKIGAKGTYAGDEVTVYRNLDTGNVRVEYGPPLLDEQGKVIRASNDNAIINLEYRAPEVIEPTISKTGKVTHKGGKTKSEFSAAETEPQVANWDGDIEWEGLNEVNKVEDLLRDTSDLQKYATGKKLTIKELSESMKKRKDFKNLSEDTMNQVEYIEAKHGPGPDPSDYAEWGDEGLASGGRVPLAGGKKAGRPKGKREHVWTHGKQQSYLIDQGWDDMDPDDWLHILKLLRAGEIGGAEGGRVPFLKGGGGIKNLMKWWKARRTKEGISGSVWPARISPDMLKYMSAGEKATYKDLRIQWAETILDGLKKDKELIEHLGKTKKMEDPGLDFMMGKFKESFDETGRLGKYVDIDKDIMNMEMILKNMKMKGRKPNASGGLAYMLGEPTYAEGGRIGFRKGRSRDI
jgi:hypothetical protein